MSSTQQYRCARGDDCRFMGLVELPGRRPSKPPSFEILFLFGVQLLLPLLKRKHQSCCPPPSTYPRHIHSRGGGRTGYPIGTIFCVPMTINAPHPTPGPGPQRTRTRRGTGGGSVRWCHGYANNCTYGAPRTPPSPESGHGVGRSRGWGGQDWCFLLRSNNSKWTPTHPKSKRRRF